MNKFCFSNLIYKAIYKLYNDYQMICFPFCYKHWWYIYIYNNRHVFCPSQDSSVWLGLTSREQLMSPECCKHQVLSFAKMLYIWCISRFFLLFKMVPLEKYWQLVTSSVQLRVHFVYYRRKSSQLLTSVKMIIAVIEICL